MSERLNERLSDTLYPWMQDSGFTSAKKLLAYIFAALVAILGFFVQSTYVEMRQADADNSSLNVKHETEISDIQSNLHDLKSSINASSVKLDRLIEHFYIK